MKDQPLKHVTPQETYRLIEEVITPAFKQLGEQLEKLLPIFSTLYNALWKRYLDAGAPYGETADGMVQWYREGSEESGNVGT